MRSPDEVYPGWPAYVVLCREAQMLMSQSRSPMSPPMRYQGPDSELPASPNSMCIEKISKIWIRYET